MSKTLAVANGTAPRTELAPAVTIEPETLEKLIINGDLKGLDSTQRVDYYMALCRTCGLNPVTQPFQYLEFQGKLRLYATKTATDQLCNLHQLTVEVVDRHVYESSGIYESHARVTFPTGRHVDDIGAVNVKGLAGEPLANAMMKAVTKSKRRTILSACGLGILDETEVETLQGAVTYRPEEEDRKALDKPVPAAKKATTKDERSLMKFIEAGMKASVDVFRQHYPTSKAVVVNDWTVVSHLYKWAASAGLIQSKPGLKPGEKLALVEPLYAAKATRKPVRHEIGAYCHLCLTAALDLAAKESAEDSGDPDDDLPTDIIPSDDTFEAVRE